MRRRFIQKKLIKGILTALILVVSMEGLFALSGREIMEKNSALPNPGSAKSTVAMTIYRNGGRVENKEFKLISKKVKDGDRVLMKFLKPTRIKFLSHSKKGEKSEQWIKRKNGKAKKIAGSDKGKRFVHSHFYYEDIGAADIDDFEYTTTGSAKVLGVDCYKVEAVKKDNIVYDKTVIYLRKSDYFIVKSEYFQDGKLVKYLENYDIKSIDGILTPLKSVMFQAGGEQKTVLEVKNVKYNVRMSSKKFRKESL
ncbi:MAG: outer membrane lipoprotein-sorting protein [bacterium]|nr:outer membrane lipoprotein-sorting protein [bacterium]